VISYKDKDRSIEMSLRNSGKDWAERTFGKCDLGDNRRLQRLIDYAGRQAERPEGSVTEVCQGDDAAQEGAYRFLRNNAVRPKNIEDGVYAHTVELMKDDAVYLAIQDSTSVSFKHSVGIELKEQGTPTGFVVHTTLLIDAQSRIPIGLVDQERWIREEKSLRPGKRTRAKREYQSKESFKWESASERIRKRVGSTKNIVTVCDREADIFDFLKYQVERKQRFVVRASHDRYLEDSAGRLWSCLGEQPVLGEREVAIEQRGGQRAKTKQTARKARQRRVATVELRAVEAVLCTPKSLAVKNGDPIHVNLVYVLEPKPSEGMEPISWMLLTTEPVSTFEEAQKVVDYYSCRWQIEEYHKVWKSGCRIESRPLQSFENLERMLAITSSIAVRILQLKWLGDEKSDEMSCESVLSRDEWQCLRAVRCPDKPIPEKAPSMKWAYFAIARLAGWTDTKRTGKVGWQTLWKGWDKFQQHYAGWQAARNFQGVHR
jgi:hypothetical protein